VDQVMQRSDGRISNPIDPPSLLSLRPAGADKSNKRKYGMPPIHYSPL